MTDKGVGLSYRGAHGVAMGDGYKKLMRYIATDLFGATAEDPAFEQSVSYLEKVGFFPAQPERKDRPAVRQPWLFGLGAGNNK